MVPWLLCAVAERAKKRSYVPGAYVLSINTLKTRNGPYISLFLCPDLRLEGHVSSKYLQMWPHHPHVLLLPCFKISIWAVSVKTARETMHVPEPTSSLLKFSE